LNRYEAFRNAATGFGVTLDGLALKRLVTQSAAAASVSP
jgi:hypothetical protein